MIDKNQTENNSPLDGDFDFPTEETFNEAALGGYDIKVNPYKKIIILVSVAVIFGLIGFEAFHLISGTKNNTLQNTFASIKKEVTHEAISEQPALHAQRSEESIQKQVKSSNENILPITPPPAEIHANVQADKPLQTDIKIDHEEANFNDVKALFNSNNNLAIKDKKNETHNLPLSKSEPTATVKVAEVGHKEDNINQQLADLTHTSDIKKLMDMVNVLQAQSSAGKLQQNQLEVVLNNLSHTLNKISSDLKTMDTRIVGLNNTVVALSSDLNTVKHALNDDGIDILNALPPLHNNVATKQSSKKETLSYKAPEYVVHAVIPGRAWLKPSSHGNILTVTEGDSVGDYGKVLAIDAANGIVLMSSGISFR